MAQSATFAAANQQAEMSDYSTLVFYDVSKYIRAQWSGTDAETHMGLSSKILELSRGPIKYFMWNHEIKEIKSEDLADPLFLYRAASAQFSGLNPEAIVGYLLDVARFSSSKGKIHLIIVTSDAEASRARYDNEDLSGIGYNIQRDAADRMIEKYIEPGSIVSRVTVFQNMAAGGDNNVRINEYISPFLRLAAHEMYRIRLVGNTSADVLWENSRDDVFAIRSMHRISNISEFMQRLPTLIKSARVHMMGRYCTDYRMAIACASMFTRITENEIAQLRDPNSVLTQSGGGESGILTTEFDIVMRRLDAHIRYCWIDYPPGHVNVPSKEDELECIRLVGELKALRSAQQNRLSAIEHNYYTLFNIFFSFYGNSSPLLHLPLRQYVRDTLTPVHLRVLCMAWYMENVQKYWNIKDGKEIPVVGNASVINAEDGSEASPSEREDFVLVVDMQKRPSVLAKLPIKSESSSAYAYLANPLKTLETCRSSSECPFSAIMYAGRVTSYDEMTFDHHKNGYILLGANPIHAAITDRTLACMMGVPESLVFLMDLWFAILWYRVVCAPSSIRVKYDNSPFEPRFKVSDELARAITDQLVWRLKNRKVPAFLSGTHSEAGGPLTFGAACYTVIHHVMHCLRAGEYTASSVTSIWASAELIVKLCNLAGIQGKERNMNLIVDGITSFHLFCDFQRRWKTFLPDSIITWTQFTRALYQASKILYIRRRFTVRPKEPSLYKYSANGTPGNSDDYPISVIVFLDGVPTQDMIHDLKNLLPQVLRNCTADQLYTMLRLGTSMMPRTFVEGPFLPLPEPKVYWDEAFGSGNVEICPATMRPYHFDVEGKYGAYTFYREHGRFPTKSIVLSFESCIADFIDDYKQYPSADELIFLASQRYPGLPLNIVRVAEQVITAYEIATDHWEMPPDTCRQIIRLSEPLDKRIELERIYRDAKGIAYVHPGPSSV